MTVIDVSVVLVSYNTARLLEPCIAALRASMGDLEVQVIVVDNASSDESVRLLRNRFVECELIESRANVGFGRANNQALALARGRYVLLLNTDAFVSPDTLGKTIAYMDAHAGCGVLGVRLIGGDGEQQPSCRNFPTLFNTFAASVGLPRWLPRLRMVDDPDWDPTVTRGCDWVPGCYYLIRRDAIDQVGLFDPRFFMYFEEVDHCRAVKRAGWDVVYFADTTVVHLGGASAAAQTELAVVARQIAPLQIESWLLYFRKHDGLLGVCLSMLFVGIADVVLALKSLVKGRPVAELAVHASHFAAVWRLFRRTSMGRVPTR